jgi:CubicO group peptidase (beta-lactamase class C family)
MLESRAPYPVPVPADSFTGWRTHVLVGEANDGNCWHGFGGVAGHAGLFTTASDLLSFGRAVVCSLDGDGPWSPDVVEEFLRPGRDAGQALGFRIADAGYGTMAWHPGFPGVQLGIIPARRLVVVLLTNRLHTSGEPRTLDDEWSRLVLELTDP